MLGEFMPIVILCLVAGGLCAAMVTLSWVLGPKKVTPYKASPYECGVTPLGDAQERFPIKFYLVAILFVLFDVEVVFLWSWLVIFKNPLPGASVAANQQFQIFSGAIVGIYLLLWIIGDAYVLKIGAVDWDESTTALPEEKLGEVNAA